MRTEQLKLMAPSMTPFVQTMQQTLQQKVWERSVPAETSGRSHIASAGSPHAASNWDGQLVDSKIVNQMVSMGFAVDGASLAAMKTGNTGGTHCLFSMASCTHCGHGFCSMHRSLCHSPLFTPPDPVGLCKHVALYSHLVWPHRHAQNAH